MNLFLSLEEVNMQKGVVLISTLIIVLMLSSIAALITKDFFLVLNNDKQLSFSNDAYFLADFAEAMVKEKILDHVFNVAKDDVSYSTFFDSEYKYNYDDMLISVSISDASSCFNVNSIFSKRDQGYVLNSSLAAGFVQFLDINILSSAQKQLLVDQIGDWVDYDQDVRDSGLEDYFYTGPMYNNQTYTSGRLFYHISELYNLPAVTQLNLDITDLNICAYPIAKEFVININMLSVKDIKLLLNVFPRLSSEQAEGVLSFIENEKFRDLNHLKDRFSKYDFSQNSSSIGYSFRPFLFKLKTTVSYKKKKAFIESVILLNDQQKSIPSFKQLNQQVYGI